MAAAIGAASPRRVADAAALARLLAPGERLYLPGSAAEVPSFVNALCDGTAPPVTLTTSFVPGINPSPVDQLPEGGTYESTFAHPVGRGSQLTGRMRHLPLSYFGFVSHLHRLTFDTCVVQVSPPGPDGLCSYGAAVEFTPLVVRRARRVLAVINPQMPRVPGAETFRLTDATAIAEVDAPLRPYDVGEPTQLAQAIALNIARFVEDGATVQIGLGKVPDALLRLLSGRRRLRLHSGMLSDGARLLADTDCLDMDYPHVSCVHVGTSSYYSWLDGNPILATRSCAYTHAPGTLAGLERLTVVNGALSVDLFGQANLEMLDGRMVSAIGGAADFARAAAVAPGGISIVALPSVSGKNQVSRLVPRLEGPVSLPRQDIDVVVTENGAADLRGCSVVERANRLIAIAAEAHRLDLERAWSDIAARL